MSKIEITRHTSVEAGVAFERVKNIMSDDNSQMKKWDPNYRCDFEENAIHIKGKHLDATITISPCDEADRVTSQDNAQAASIIHIKISLPLMLTPFKKIVKTSLEKQLDKAFGKKLF